MLKIKQIELKDIKLGTPEIGELTDNTETSLMTFGLLTPIIVTEAENGMYDVVDGRKRALTVKLSMGEEHSIDAVVIDNRKATEELKLVLNNTKNVDDLSNAEAMKNMFPNGFADKKAVKQRIEELSEETGIAPKFFKKWIKIALMDADLMDGFKKGLIERELISKLSTLSDKYYRGTTHEYQEEVFVELKKKVKNGEVITKDIVKALEEEHKPEDLIQEELKRKFLNTFEKCLENNLEKNEVTNWLKA